MAAVEVFDDASVLDTHGTSLCLILPTGDDESVRRVLTVMGIDVAAGSGPLGESGSARPHRWRPDIRDQGGHLTVTLTGVQEDCCPVPIQMWADDRVLLIVADGDVADDLRRSVAGYHADDSPHGAVAAAGLGLTYGISAALAEVADEISEEGEQPRGFTRSRQRRRIRRQRSRVFQLQSLLELQSRLFGHDEELHDLLPAAARPTLKRARAASAFAASTAAQLYAAAGDLMAEQDAQVSERLTLVSTVFLPLTVVTGFFGMNFAWLTARLGSLSTFVLLGVVTPVLVTLATLAAVRRMGAGSSSSSPAGRG